MARTIRTRLAFLILLTAGTTACEEGTPFARGTTDGPTAQTSGAPTRTVEQDVEAPEVFSVTESGLWDGRPSLGGIWVAHPDVSAPERVKIRNTDSGKEVVGALFRREREMPGPRIQVSSEAAVALGLLAGQPTELSVIAIRREQIPVAAPEVQPDATSAEDAAPGEIKSTKLDPAKTAAAALEAVGAVAPESRPAKRPARGADPVGSAAAPAETQIQSEPKATEQSPRPVADTAVELPFIQIGIFSVEENARNAGESLRAAGIVPTVHQQTSGDTSYWRVIVGPATSDADRDAVLEQVKGLGYTDAYAVAN